MSTILSAALLHGVVLCLVMSVIIFASLYQNPKIWVKSSPPDVRAFVGPMDPTTEKQRRTWGVLMMLSLIVIFGHLAQSVAALSPSVFWTVFWASYVCFQVFNLFDAVVIDLGLVLLKPKWAFLPGTAELPGLTDPKWHIKNYFVGVVIGAPFSLMVAGLAWLLL